MGSSGSVGTVTSEAPRSEAAGPSPSSSPPGSVAAASGAGRREALRGFLRSRRERVAPADVGLVAGGRRRTPGLRREEVALLAGVGVSWYTWLEQGRDINASPEVVDAVARALRLTEPERAHLYLLTGLNPPPPGGPGTGGYGTGAAVSDELRRVIDAWAPRPAMVLDRYWNLLAVNDGARAVFGYGDEDRNCLVSFFTNTRYRAMHVGGEAIAADVVATFRADARTPDDPEFARLAGELAAASTEFAALWARHDVATPAQAVKAIRHPRAGDLAFDLTTLAVPDRPCLRVELYNPRPGTGTDEALARLAPAPVAVT